MFTLKRKRNSFLKSHPDGQSCGNLGKTNCKSFREDSTLSNMICPEKNYPRYYIPRKKNPDLSSLFFQPAQPTHRQHLLPGPPAPTTYLEPHSRQEKLALIPTRRHEDGPPSRARRLGARVSVRRGCGALGCLGCSLPLLACPGKSALARTSVAMPECYLS